MATWKSEIQTPMAQGRSTTIMSMIQWTRTKRLSKKISLSLCVGITVSAVTKVSVGIKGYVPRKPRGSLLRARIPPATRSESFSLGSRMVNFPRRYIFFKGNSSVSNKGGKFTSGG